MPNHCNDRPNIVVEVLGGCVTSVYTDVPHARVFLIDWDNLEESEKLSEVGGEVGCWPYPMSRMPAETLCVYKLSQAEV
jgi:hypothetical protein